MRHGPDIGLRCCSTCSKITSVPMKKHEADDNPLPSPMHPVCAFKTSPCVPAPRAHMFQHVRVVASIHGDVLNAHTEDVLIVSHHTTPHTHHTTRHNKQDTTQNTTNTQPQQHTKSEKEDRKRERQTERRERRQRQREEKTEDKEKRRRRVKSEERREKREERREKRGERREKREKRQEMKEKMKEKTREDERDKRREPHGQDSPEYYIHIRFVFSINQQLHLHIWAFLE